MKNLFVPYNIAKRLKDLGFDEPCLGFYSKKYDYSEKEFDPKLFISENEIETLMIRRIVKDCSAPLWQQVTAWLRDTKKINIFVGFRMNVKKWDAHYYDMNLTGKEYVKIQTMDKFINREVFDTYEEALESAIIDYINHL